MNATFDRPEALDSRTYKIKVPTYENAVYVTISDYVVNKGEPDERTVPWEIFLSSKDMSQFQWITGLMRTISFLFRNAPDKVIDLVAELKTVVDPKDGHYSRKGYSGFIPSLVADIAMQIENHLKYIGMVK